MSASDKAPVPVLSSRAGGLALETQVILGKTDLSPQDLARISQEGGLDLPDPWKEVVWLQVGGAVVAQGRLVRKGGKTCFQVTRTAEFRSPGQADWPNNQVTQGPQGQEE